MFKKLVSTIILGTVAAAAYYLYKNRNGAADKTADDKVVHFIPEASIEKAEAEKTAEEKATNKARNKKEKSE